MLWTKLWHHPFIPWSVWWNFNTNDLLRLIIWINWFIAIIRQYIINTNYMYWNGMIDLIGQPRSQIFKIKNIFIQFNRYTSVHNVQKKHNVREGYWMDWKWYMVGIACMHVLIEWYMHVHNQSPKRQPIHWFWLYL